MRSIGFLTIALATVVVTGCDRTGAKSGDSAVGTTGSGQPRISRADRKFVHDMTVANMAEVELGTLAPERSTDDEVKKFAALMIDDHTKSLNRLKAIAAQYNVPVPTELDAKRKRMREKIAAWHGDAFDRAYMDAMADEHEDALDMLEPRVDEQKLAEYKAELTDRLTGKTAVERAEVVAVIPEKNDNPLTFSLNEWAAAAYPIVQAHLTAARTLKLAVEKKPRTTN
jgi:putative membrane protein